VPPRDRRYLRAAPVALGEDLSLLVHGPGPTPTAPRKHPHRHTGSSLDLDKNLSVHPRVQAARFSWKTLADQLQASTMASQHRFPLTSPQRALQLLTPVTLAASPDRKIAGPGVRYIYGHVDASCNGSSR
jgi:hypothetical protein